MADIRINSLPTTATSTSFDDYVAVDGSGNGTRKLSAYSPTFGGNLTVSGTGTSSVAGTLNVSGGFILNRINAKGIYTGTSDNCGFTWTGTNGEFSTASGSLILKSAGTTALTLDAYQNATIANNLFVNGTAVNTFAGSIATTGANLLFQASTSIIDHSTGLFRAIGYGPNTSTAGGFSFIGLSSNGTVGGTRFSIDSSGNPIFGADQGSGGTGNIRAYFGGTTALSNGLEINTANSNNVTLTFRSYLYGYSSNPRFVAYRGGGAYGLTLDGGDYTATSFAVYGKQIIGNTYSQNNSSTADLTINPATKTSGNLLDAQVGGSSKFAVDFAGNVTVSGGQIALAALSSTPSVLITQTDSAGYSIVRLRNTGGTAQSYDFAVGGSGTGSLAQKFYIYDNTAGVARLAIAPTGNVLLGTTTDNGLGRLQVSGAITATEAAGTGLFGFFGGAALISGTLGAQSFILRTNNTNALTLDSSQNATFAGSIRSNQATNISLTSGVATTIFSLGTSAGVYIFTVTLDVNSNAGYAIVGKGAAGNWTILASAGSQMAFSFSTNDLQLTNHSGTTSTTNTFNLLRLR